MVCEKQSKKKWADFFQFSKQSERREVSSLSNDRDNCGLPPWTSNKRLRLRPIGSDWIAGSHVLGFIVLMGLRISETRWLSLVACLRS